MGLQFHPELDHDLLELFTDDLRGGGDGDLGRLGLRDDLRAHLTTSTTPPAGCAGWSARFLDRVTG